MALKLGIVGATGVVGLEARKLAAEILGFPVEMLLFASTARPDDKILALETSRDALRSCDVILNAASSDQAKFIRENMSERQILVDNSSAYRMEKGIPLVVPEVNGTELSSVKSMVSKIVANPNCTAAILCVALSPLKKYGMKRVQVSTYQAASGAGIKGLDELMNQIRDWRADESAPVKGGSVFRHPLFLNVMSHNSPMQAPGTEGELHNEEEWKVIIESQKILAMPQLPMGITSMRVPVLRAHTEAVSIQFDKSVSLEDLKKSLSTADGIKIVDSWQENHFPMPVEAQNQDLVLVGRIRKDLFDPHWAHFLISGDQLRKGAASNALQIIRDLRKTGVI